MMIKLLRWLDYLAVQQSLYGVGAMWGARGPVTAERMERYRSLRPAASGRPGRIFLDWAKQKAGRL